MFIVRHKDTKQVIVRFKTRAEANYYITDVFGPQWHAVEIIKEPS